jgi:hypothetical protein
MITAFSPEGRRLINESQKRWAFEHASAFLQAVIAEGGPSRLQARAEKLYFPMKAGYLSFGWGGEVSALSRGKETFRPSAFFGTWRSAVERAKARYYRELPARREAQEAALRAALENASEAGRASGSSGALPPGFEGFGAEVFGLEDEPAPEPRFNQFEPLKNLKKGDTIRIGGATYVVHRNIGTYQTDVYKQGVKRPYLLHQIDRDRIGIRVMRGTMESTLAEPPVLIVDVSKVKFLPRAE